MPVPARDRSAPTVTAPPLPSAPPPDHRGRGQLHALAAGADTIQRRFEAQADCTPDAIALEDGIRRFTYRELDARADALGHALEQAGLVPGELVGVLLERSLAAIIAMLAILKAGGAYLPLDPAHPRERLRTLLADAGARLVLVAPGSGVARDLGGLTALEVDERQAAPMSARGAPRRRPGGGPEDLAYVMYTSGSTGVPKGVEILHRGVLRLVVGADYARFAGETFLQLAPLAFDAATFEVWGALLNGGRLVVMTGQATPAMIRRTIAAHRVTTLWLTAGLFQLLADGPLAELRGLRQLLAGGDVLSVTHVLRVLQGLPQLRLINGYGPTENTTFTCCHTVAEPLGATVPIGRPIRGTTVAILDDQLRPLPAGAIGEICTGGLGLARGYRGRPGLTAEAFVTVTGADGSARRLYRTGDLGLMRPDGVLEFISRTDRQVKIRGNRVEIGEIEVALLRHPLLRAALVVAVGGDAFERALHAYVVPRGTVAPSAAELRDFLAAQLPPFMVPAAFVVLAELPLTANGKIDRAALPAAGLRPASARLAAGAPALPALEAKLLAVWAQVLQVPDLTRDDSLGALGVNSLTAAHLVDEIQRACGRAPALSALTEETTVRLLARALEQGGGEPAADAILRLHEQGGGQPFFYLHGDMHGIGMYCHHLAEVLGSAVPFYALPTCRLDQTEYALSVAEMAALHLRTLRMLRPAGPYRLGGYCNGGVIATAMAELLRSQGEQVTVLVLIDAEAAYPRLRWCRRLAQLLRLAGASEDRRIAAFRRIANAFTNAIADPAALPARGLRAQAAGSSAARRARSGAGCAGSARARARARAAPTPSGATSSPPTCGRWRPSAPSPGMDGWCCCSPTNMPPAPRPSARCGARSQASSPWAPSPATIPSRSASTSAPPPAPYARRWSPAADRPRASRGAPAPGCPPLPAGSGRAALQLAHGGGVACAQGPGRRRVEVQLIAAVGELGGGDHGVMRELALQGMQDGIEGGGRLRVVSLEHRQFAGDEGHLGACQILAQALDQRGELLGVGGGGAAGGLALVPQDALQRALGERREGAREHVIVGMGLGRGIGRTRHPDRDRGAADRAGDEADALARRSRGHGPAEREPGPDAGSRLVEMEGIGSRDPLALLGEHEHARVGLRALRIDLAAPGHVGLADQQVELEVGIRRAAGARAHAGQAEQQGAEQEQAAEGGQGRLGSGHGQVPLRPRWLLPAHFNGELARRRRGTRARARHPRRCRPSAAGSPRAPSCRVR